jgi:hypothetical protein
MTLSIKGADKSKRHLMKRAGRDPRGLAYFDKDSINRNLSHLYSLKQRFHPSPARSDT